MRYQLPAPLKKLFAKSHNRQLAAWIICVGLGVVINAYGLHRQIDPQILTQFALFFIVDSAVFLAIYRDYPKLGIVMLIFLYTVLLSVFGYFALAAASFAL